MTPNEQFDVARSLRRELLGDAYVDGQASEPNSVAADFQDYLTSTAWGVWARGAPLSTRDRSLLVLAMTAALGRMDEFRLHASINQRTGVSDHELDELPFQIAAYCGAPAGRAAWRAIAEVRAERDQQQ
jgi:4-carboxymuconolactone decarboxylase